MGIIGSAILAFGLFIIWLGVSRKDTEISQGGLITLLVFAGIFVLAGLLLLIVPIRASLNMKNGKHPLVNAITQNDTQYVLWMYEYITRVRSGPATRTDHKIWILCRDRKHFSVDVKKSKAQEVIDYLSLKFPSAVVGYTKELEDEYYRKVS